MSFFKPNPMLISLGHYGTDESIGRGSALLAPYDEIIVSIRESVTTAGDSGGGGGSEETREELATSWL